MGSEGVKVSLIECVTHYKIEFKADLFILAWGDHCFYNYKVIFEISTEIQNL